jgi:hypothetical protein
VLGRCEAGRRVRERSAGGRTTATATRGTFCGAFVTRQNQNHSPNPFPSACASSPYQLCVCVPLPRRSGESGRPVHRARGVFIPVPTDRRWTGREEIPNSCLVGGVTSHPFNHHTPLLVRCSRRTHDRRWLMLALVGRTSFG